MSYRNMQQVVCTRCIDHFFQTGDIRLEQEQLSPIPFSVLMVLFFLTRLVSFL